MAQIQKHYVPLSAAAATPNVGPHAVRMVRDLFTLQRYRITIEGISLVIVSTLIGFAAWHSGTNLLYLVFATLIALFLIHGLLVWLCVVGIRMERVLPTHVYAGRPCPVAIRLHNRKHYVDSHGLRVSDLGHHNRSIGVVFFGTIPKHGSSEEIYETVFASRGMYDLKNLEAITRYPFGLVERGLKLHIPQQLLVYPQVYEVGGLGPNLVAGFGDQDVPEKGFGTELYGLREYVPGEHARHIHWRSSARMQRVMVMEYERDERRHVTLLLWNVVQNPGDEQVKENFETAICLVASLANFLIREQFEVRLVTANGNTADGQGRSHLYTILRVLATLPLLAPGQEQATAGQNGSVVRVRFHDGELQLHRNSEEIAVDARQYTVKAGRFVRAIAE